MAVLRARLASLPVPLAGRVSRQKRGVTLARVRRGVHCMSGGNGDISLTVCLLKTSPALQALRAVQDQMQRPLNMNERRTLVYIDLQTNTI
jgi:hypothetical protein